MGVNNERDIERVKEYIKRARSLRKELETQYRTKVSIGSIFVGGVIKLFVALGLLVILAIVAGIINGSNGRNVVINYIVFGVIAFFGIGIIMCLPRALVCSVLNKLFGSDPKQEIERLDKLIEQLDEYWISIDPEEAMCRKNLSL